MTRARALLIGLILVVLLLAVLAEVVGAGRVAAAGGNARLACEQAFGYADSVTRALLRDALGRAGQGGAGARGVGAGVPR